MHCIYQNLGIIYLSISINFKPIALQAVPYKILTSYGIFSCIVTHCNFIWDTLYLLVYQKQLYNGNYNHSTTALCLRLL